MNELQEKQLRQKYFEFQLLEQQLKEIQQQHQLLNMNLQELLKLKESLKEVETIKEKKQILAQLGPRVFIKTELLEKNTVLVDIGSNVVLEKTILEAQGIIQAQMRGIEENLSLLEKHQTQIIHLMQKTQQELEEQEAK